MKKILITGGAGFIGTHLCNRLSDKDNELFVIDSFVKQVHGGHPSIKRSDNVDFTVGDVSVPETWEQFYDMEFDALIHLAAETGTGQSMYDSRRCCKTNVMSTAIINDLVASEKLKIGKIILASSRAVYGEANIDADGNPIPSNENDVTSPVSIYGASKLMQEHILLQGVVKSSVCVLRLQNVYGIGQSMMNPYTGIISIFSNLIRNNKSISIFEDGMMSRDFVYIDDVIDSIMICLDSPEANGQIFNVGTGVRTTVLDVAHMLMKCFGTSVEINITGAKRKGDIRHNFADLSKISLLGFSPKICIADGLANFVEWAKFQELSDTAPYYKSMECLKKTKLLTN